MAVMDKLELALESFKALLKDIDKEELKSIVKKIDGLDVSSNSYKEYLNCFDNEFSFMFEDFDSSGILHESFLNFELVDCGSEIIEYDSRISSCQVLVNGFGIDFNILSEGIFPQAA